MSDIILPARYYVYLLSHPDGRPFYVGKGSGTRVLRHMEEAKRKHCVCPKCKIIRSLWSVGREPVVSFPYVTNDSADAYRAERETIYSLGREYKLTNANAPTPVMPSPSSTTYREYLAWLDRVDASQKERPRMLAMWTSERAKCLRGQRTSAAVRGDDERVAEIRAELEEMRPKVFLAVQMPLTNF